MTVGARCPGEPDNVIVLSNVRGGQPDASPPETAGPGESAHGVFQEGAVATGDFEGEEPGPLPTPEELPAALEAVLFAVGSPAPMSLFLRCFPGLDAESVEAALDELARKLDRGGRGLQLVEVAGGWQLRTRPALGHWVARARGARPFKLSRAALETLAVVAYRQPVTRAEVEEIRGVDAGGVLRSLLQKGMLRVTGRRDEPGRPLTYGTTERFLEVFGLRDLDDLPRLRDLEELGTPPQED